MYYRTLKRALAALITTLFVSGAITTSGQNIFDDFNVDEGHFTSDPNFSGSSLNDAASSAADRFTTDGPIEGAGHQRLALDWEDNADTGVNLQIRHLSGGGTPANNTTFTTSAGTDGWIGFYLKVDPIAGWTTPWTAQLWIEGAENNGGVPKTILNDGAWHLYEWNLDDESGGPDGWGAVAGIAAGDADVQVGTYTIDSIILRGDTTPNTTIYLDFVAKSASGSIAAMVPEPSTYAMFAIGLAGFAGYRRLKLAKR